MSSPPAFPFVIDTLFPLNPVVRPMFGSHAVYVGDKIVMVLRQRKDHQEANGVWIATSKQHHASLKEELPSLCSVYLLSEGKSETNWQMIPLDAEEFEEEVLRACELILDGDSRIGRIPKSKVRSQKSKGGR